MYYYLVWYSDTFLDDKITCTVPSVKPLEDTVLTCHFSEDVSVSKKGFTVYHYAKDGSPGEEATIWKKYVISIHSLFLSVTLSLSQNWWISQ